MLRNFLGAGGLGVPPGFSHNLPRLIGIRRKSKNSGTAILEAILALRPLVAVSSAVGLRSVGPRTDRARLCVDTDL